MNVFIRSVRAVPNKADFCCDINPILTPRHQTVTFFLTGRDVSDLVWIYNSFFCVGCFPWDLKGLGVGGFCKKMQIPLQSNSCVLGTVGGVESCVTQDPIHHAIWSGDQTDREKQMVKDVRECN